MSKKRLLPWLLSGIALGAVSIGFFGKALLWHGFVFALHRIDPHATVQCEYVSFGRGGLSVHHLDMQGAFGHVKADKLKLGLFCKLKAFQFKPHITLIKPVWDVPDQISLGKSKKRKVFIDVIDGTLKRGENCLPFQFTSGAKPSDLGLVEIGQSEIMLKKFSDQLAVIARFHHTDLSELAPFSDLLSPHWKPKKGILTGFLTASFDANGDLNDFGGDFEGEGVEFAYQKRQLHFGAKSFAWKGDFPAAKTSVDEGFVFALSKKLPAHWGMRISGGVDKGKVTLDGCMMREGERFPFMISGKGQISKDASLLASLDIKGAGQSQIDLALKRSQSAIRAQFRDISSKQLLIFRDGLGAFFPLFRSLELEGEKLNADLNLAFTKNNLTRLKADNIKAETIAIRWPSKHVEMQGKHMHLAGVLPFDEGPSWKKASWEFSLDEGLGSGLSDLSVDLAVANQEIQKGIFKGKWKGVDFDATSEGTFQEPKIAVTASSNIAEVSHVLGSDSDCQEKVRARVLFDRKESLWGAAGSLSGDVGQLTFGTHFSTKKRDFKGWLEGEEVSPALYTLATKYLDLDFSVDGFVNLSATFDTNAFECALSSNELTLCSKGVKMTLPHLDRHPYYQGPLIQHAMIHLDRKQNTWKIAVPLINATLEEDTYGLSFHHLEGTAVLENKHLYVQDLKAKIYDIDLKSHLSLQFYDENSADLYLSAVDFSGESRDVLKVLRHFERFKGLELPLTGKMLPIDESPFSLHVPFGQKDKETAFSAFLKLEDGSYRLTDQCLCQALKCSVKYTTEDEVLELGALDGEVQLVEGEKRWNYDFNAPSLRILDIDHGDLEFDVRIESQTHDLMRFKGASHHEKGWMLDQNYSHFFGGKIELKQLAMEPFSFAAHTDLKLEKLNVAFRFLRALNLFQTSFETEPYRLKGDLAVDIDYKPGEFNLELSGEDIKIKGYTIPHFALKLDKEQEMISLDHLTIGAFDARGLATKKENTWELSLFEIDWEKTHLQTFAGHFANGQMHVKIDQAAIDLKQIQPILPLSKRMSLILQGLMNVDGEFCIDIHRKSIDGNVLITSENFSHAEFQLATAHPIHLFCDQDKGLSLCDVSLKVKDDQAEIDLAFDDLTFEKKEKRWRAPHLQLSCTPEMVTVLAEYGFIPHLDKGMPFSWDNHLEAQVALDSSPQSFSLNAELKDGYYWLGNSSCLLKKGTLKGTNAGLFFEAKTAFNQADFTVKAAYPFRRSQDVTLILDDHSEINDIPLKCILKKNSNLALQSIKGSFFGLDIDFERNQTLDNSQFFALTGEVNIDWSDFKPLLPKPLSQIIQDYDMGRGYKLTGDVLVNNSDLKKSQFKGYFKGRNFELFGYKFKNLLSNFEYSNDYLLFQNVSISDEALALAIPHINLAGKKISIPTLTLHDLRPSLLQKCGRLPGRLKPFVIKHLEFQRIQGTLGDKQSFSGKGNLSFINTFKRDFSLLDLPKEIFGRIGLDVGLLVPVRGDLFCELDGTRIHFSKLENAYSDGERSEFFLPTKKPAYIDLDGQIHIDLRMKQYVLLKITEPFTLSIRGSLDRPKFSLK